jgi:ribosomal protein L16 Arg81 hydroxylase
MDKYDIQLMIDDKELDIREWVTALLETFSSAVDERERRQDELIQQFERQVALITQAYAEMAAMLEALISSIINSDETKRQEFFEALKASRTTMVDTLNYAKQTAEGSTDRFVAYDTGADSQRVDRQESSQ